MDSRTNDELRMDYQPAWTVRIITLDYNTATEYEIYIKSYIKGSSVNNCDSWHAMNRNWWSIINKWTGVG